MAIGYLTMQARTAHDAVPLSNVQITVFDDQGNTVYKLSTDESGETPAVPLETLDKSFSQNAYFTGTPFISYHVLAQASGFNSLYISDIPIYEDDTAVLPLALTPMLELQRAVRRILRRSKSRLPPGKSLGQVQTKILVYSQVQLNS